MLFLPFFLFLFLSFLLFIFRTSSTPASTYTDSTNTSWPVPRSTWLSHLIDTVIEMVPRFDGKFNLLDPDFDLEDSLYLETSTLYIVLCGSIGLLLLAITVASLLVRHFCRCCKMKRYYPETQIVKTRVTIMFLAFVLEGFLIYGFFANTDLHGAVSSLTARLSSVGTSLSNNLSLLLSNLPPVTSSTTVYDRYATEFRADLEFSARYARGQSSAMESFSGRNEGYRMALILTNLILTTISCSVGVAAGSINSEIPLFVMICCNGVSLALVYFSAGVHFAGSKIVLDYCSEAEFYLAGAGVGEPLPQRLQFFVPSIVSPVLPYVQDYYVVQAAWYIGELRDVFAASEVWGSVGGALPEWFNVSDAFYTEQIARVGNESVREELEVLVENARAMARFLEICEIGQTASVTREVMRENRFVFCVYLRDNLDVLTVTQVVAGLVLAALTLFGVSSLNLFRYAGMVYRRKPQARRAGAAH